VRRGGEEEVFGSDAESGSFVREEERDRVSSLAPFLFSWMIDLKQDGERDERQKLTPEQLTSNRRVLLLLWFSRSLPSSTLKDLVTTRRRLNPLLLPFRCPRRRVHPSVS